MGEIELLKHEPTMHVLSKSLIIVYNRKITQFIVEEFRNVKNICFAYAKSKGAPSLRIRKKTIANELFNTFKCYKQMVKMSGLTRFSRLNISPCKIYVHD